MGWGIEPRKIDIAGAESLYSLEGNMCGTVMRGADALPGSKARSHAKGSHRKHTETKLYRRNAPVPRGFEWTSDFAWWRPDWPAGAGDSNLRIRNRPVRSIPPGAM